MTGVVLRNRQVIGLAIPMATTDTHIDGNIAYCKFHKLAICTVQQHKMENNQILGFIYALIPSWVCSVIKSIFKLNWDVNVNVSDSVYIILCAYSLASQQKAIKQKMAGSKATLVKRFDELKKEIGVGTAGTRYAFWYDMSVLFVSLFVVCL